MAKEIETTKYVCRCLEEAGLTPRVYQNHIGVTADLRIGDPQPDEPLIALRADMDALRLFDEKDVEYSSKNVGFSHSCGHDAHTTMVLAEAMAAADLQKSLPKAPLEMGLKLRFLFQPAEETCEGARSMVEQGAIDDVDAILALHVDPERPTGEIGLRDGILTADCDEIDFDIRGQGGHAARPHHTIDPIATAAQLINALYQFVPRSIDSRDPAVFTVGKISGGYAHNVIPERVQLSGTLRAIGQDTRERIKERIREIAHGVSESSGARIIIEFSNSLGSVNNDPRINAVLTSAASSVLGGSGVKIIDKPSMGSEDFGVYLEKVPGAMMRLGCAKPDESSHFLHSPTFDIDERALVLGPRIILRAVLLLSEQLRSDSGDK